jgi:hypothetical protein
MTSRMFGNVKAFFSVRRLARDRGIVPIPRSLPGYRAALSLGRNQAWLTVGKRVTAAGSFAPGTNVLGRPGDEFDGEMRNRVDMLLFLMEPCYVGAQFESFGLPGHRTELRDLPARRDLRGLINAPGRINTSDIANATITAIGDTGDAITHGPPLLRSKTLPRRQRFGW